MTNSSSAVGIEHVHLTNSKSQARFFAFLEILPEILLAKKNYLYIYLSQGANIPGLRSRDLTHKPHYLWDLHLRAKQRVNTCQSAVKLR